MSASEIVVRVPEYGYEALVAKLEESVGDFADFSLRVPFAAEYPHSKVLRDTVSYVLQKNRINPPWNRRFALISDELVNNAIEHGSAPGDEDVFELAVSTDPATRGVTFRLAVSDTGRGKSTKDAAAMDELRAKRLQTGFENHAGNRGRGLFQIIETLVDTLEFSDNPDGGLTVRAIKTFAPETVAV